MKRTLPFIILFLQFFIIEAISQFKVDLGPDREECYNSGVAIIAKVTGGALPYKYYWNSEPDKGFGDQSTYFNYVGFLMKEDITIYVKVIDSGDQTAYDTVNVYEQSRNLIPPKITGSANSLACTNKVILTADPGYAEYEWENGEKSRIIEVTQPGGYRVKGRDNNGCLSGWSEYFNVYKAMSVCDSINLKIINPPKIIGDTFSIDITFKIGDENKKCLPVDFDFSLTQTGDNLYCVSEPYFYFDPKDKHKTYHITGTLKNQQETRRITFVKIIGRSEYGQVWYNGTDSKIKFCLDAESTIIIKEQFTFMDPVCYQGLLNNYQPSVYLNNIYPNPVNSELNVNYDVIRETDLKIFISDLNGRQNTLRKQDRLKAGSYADRFDLSDLQSGLYMMVFYFDSHFVSNIIEVGK